MLLRCLIIVFLAFPMSLTAQGLTQEECAEIRATYQFSPPQCGKSQRSSERSPSLVKLSASTQENNVFFPSGGATLDEEAEQKVMRLAKVLNAQVMQNACLRLVGHSDTSGGAELNHQVGADRAAVVRNALAPLLSNPDRVKVVESRGEERPLAEVPGTSKWQRRVEIWARPCNEQNKLTESSQLTSLKGG